MGHYLMYLEVPIAMVEEELRLSPSRVKQSHLLTTHY